MGVRDDRPGDLSLFLPIAAYSQAAVCRSDSACGPGRRITQKSCGKLANDGEQPHGSSLPRPRGPATAAPPDLFDLSSARFLAVRLCKCSACSEGYGRPQEMM